MVCKLVSYGRASAAGDFIERHAKAVSIYLPVHVIHVARIHDKNSVPVFI